MRSLVGALLLVLSGPVWAVIESYEFATEELRERYRVLTSELRCPKCQNQNIADSNAPIAQDLRRLLHRQLHAGKSDEEIADYMVQRYGVFVLYRPRWGGPTTLLWLAPLIFLVLALLLLFGSIRKGRRQASTEPLLGEAERQQLAEFTGDDSA